MAFNFYVYYRVAAGQEIRARAAVERMQRELRGATANVRILTQRHDPRLWMEVYEGVRDADAFDALLARAASALVREGVLENGSARNVECFEDAPCA
jgi:hypothetical protein